jgi:hypothetical protein
MRLGSDPATGSVILIFELMERNLYELLKSRARLGDVTENRN